MHSASNRRMRGTDWTRAVAFLTYREGVDAFRFTDRSSESEKATLMGATLREVYKGKPTKPQRTQAPRHFV
jgi:L-fuconolactonase